MPPRLELSHSTHNKVMVAPPRINLRRAASYNAQDRGPLSSTTSRFNFNHLLFSPPPSPSLPALVPQRKRASSRAINSRPRWVIRRFIFLSGFVSLLYLLSLLFEDYGSVSSKKISPITKGDLEAVGKEGLPNFPTAIMASDSSGRVGWTVSIPSDYGFPLAMEDYTQICEQCREVSALARSSHPTSTFVDQTGYGYERSEDYFVDVEKAEKTGLLPGGLKQGHMVERGQFVGLEPVSMARRPVCDTSMTFVLESSDAGIGNTLMMLWSFYSLAKFQNRPFFIDDSRWAYGTYTDIFQAPPIPNCRPPPRHHMIPCPAQAKHLVVTSGTAREVFPTLAAGYPQQVGSKDEVQALMTMAQTGYAVLFKLNKEDQEYVDRRVAELRVKARSGKKYTETAPVIGLHIRHGDNHPLEYQYKDTYIPAEVFLDTVQQLVAEHQNKTSRGPSELADHHAVTVVASDDPMVHEEFNLPHTYMAQERIKLASKDHIMAAEQDRTVLHEFVDETFGWEGGFFAPMFWNLGVSRKNNAANAPLGVITDDMNSEARFQAPPSEETLRLRSFMGRAYMMDLAVLARASDQVVCAVSASGCRILAVMMGYEQAIQHGNWINVDGTFGWMGINW